MLNGTLIHDSPLGSLALDSVFYDGLHNLQYKHTVIFLTIFYEVNLLKLAAMHYCRFWESQGDNFSLLTTTSILSPIRGKNNNATIHKIVIAAKRKTHEVKSAALFIRWRKYTLYIMANFHYKIGDLSIIFLLITRCSAIKAEKQKACLSLFLLICSINFGLFLHLCTHDICWNPNFVTPKIWCDLHLLWALAREGGSSFLLG